MATDWLNYFTAALRRNPEFGSGWWGTVEQGVDIPIGDCGYIDSSGTYHHVAPFDLGQYLGAPPDWVAQASASFQDSSVKQTSTNLGANVTYIDPETGLQVKGGLEAAWTFAESEQMSANLPQTWWQGYEPAEVQPILERVDVLQALIVLANPVGYTDAAGYLKPGFVVVYGVLGAVAGVVIGSTSKGTTFDLKGSVQGMQNLMSGGANGAYAEKDDQQGFFSWMWPAVALTDTSQLSGSQREVCVSDTNNKRTVAFKVFSFNGDSPVQDWTP